MFKTQRTQHTPTERGDLTRDRILDTALALFRKHGLDRTTMREIARRARTSLGATYYYFPSKEALVHGFYDRVQVAHRQLSAAGMTPGTDLAERIRVALTTKLDAVRDERSLLGALFRYVGERDHPMSVLGAATREARQDSIATFAAAIEGAELPAEMRSLAARALWGAHLLLLLYFIHDDSPGEARSRQLAARAAALFAHAVGLLSQPGAGAVLAPVVEMLTEARLIPTRSVTPNTEERRT